jgi:hypothetical protein
MQPYRLKISAGPEDSRDAGPEHGNRKTLFRPGIRLPLDAYGSALVASRLGLRTQLPVCVSGTSNALRRP